MIGGISGFFGSVTYQYAHGSSFSWGAAWTSAGIGAGAGTAIGASFGLAWETAPGAMAAIAGASATTVSVLGPEGTAAATALGSGA
ncbi:hypothetical protein HZB01_04040, partial [Candidatus Woesearchaeota archaeon]|nr:hypothetical protein [Candidatus Woesearchaeota archaeon]